MSRDPIYLTSIRVLFPSQRMIFVASQTIRIEQCLCVNPTKDIVRVAVLKLEIDVFFFV